MGFNLSDKKRLYYQCVPYKQIVKGSNGPEEWETLAGEEKETVLGSRLQGQLFIIPPRELEKRRTYESFIVKDLV